MDPQLSEFLDEGNVEAVCKMINDDRSLLESKNSMGYTPLLVAVSYGNLELVRALVDLGANVQALDPETGENSLHIAAKGDCKKIIKYLLGHGITIDCRTYNGCTPLHIASNYGSIGSIRKLTALGADINAKNVNGMSPLHIAVITNKRESVPVLLETILPSLDKDNFGQTALDLAKEKFGKDDELVLSISDYGEVCFLYPYLTDSEQMLRTKLHETEHKGGKYQFHLFKEAIVNKKIENVKVLLEEGVNPKITNILDQQTPLHVAAAYGVIQIMRMLIENEADIDAVDIMGNTPLHAASQNCQYQAVVELFTKGAVIKENNDGLTAIELCRDAPDDLPQKGKTMSYLVKNMGFTVSMTKIDNSKELISFLKSNKKIIKKCGEQLIFEAINKDKPDVTDFLLLNRVDSNVKDKEGKTPLIVATEQNRFEIAKQLLVYSADVDAMIESTGQTSLHIAAEKGYFEILNLLLQHNASMVDDANGMSALRIAQAKLDEGDKTYEPIVTALNLVIYRDNLKSSMYNAEIFTKELKNSPGVVEAYGPHLLRDAIKRHYFDVVKVLVSNGADINKNDEEGVNATHEAAMSGSDELMAYIIENNGDLNLKEFHGRTPLLCACTTCSAKVIKLLLEKGASYAVDDEGASPMQLIIDSEEMNKTDAINLISDFTFETAKSRLHEENELEEILEQNNYLLRDKGGYFMQWAVNNKSSETINFLISQGVSVSERDDSGSTVLITAIKSGDMDMVRILVESGSITGVHDVDGRTPLHHAALADNPEIVDYLIENGAINRKDNAGRTPFDIASKRNSRKSKKICQSISRLNEYFKEMEAVLNYHMFKEVFKKYRTKYGVHSAIKAISYNSKAHVEYLIDHGMKPTARDDKGMTLLHYCVPKNIEIAKMLIEKGANVNAVTEGGYTPLHLTCKYQNTDEFVHMLIEAGANVNATTKNNITPLFLAMKIGNTMAINSLLNKDADPNIRTETDLAPLDIAARRHNTEMIDLLINKGADEVSLEESRMKELSIKEIQKQRIKMRRAQKDDNGQKKKDNKSEEDEQKSTEEKTPKKENKSPTKEIETPAKEEENDEEIPKKEKETSKDMQVKDDDTPNEADESPNEKKEDETPKKEEKSEEKKVENNSQEKENDEKSKEPESHEKKENE